MFHLSKEECMKSRLVMRMVMQGDDIVTTRTDQVPVFKYPNQEAVVNSLRLGHKAVQVTGENYPDDCMESMNAFLGIAAQPGEEFECTNLKMLECGRTSQSNWVFTVRYKK